VVPAEYRVRPTGDVKDKAEGLKDDLDKRF
jgi:hypothetical protein